MALSPRRNAAFGKRTSWPPLRCIFALSWPIVPHLRTNFLSSRPSWPHLPLLLASSRPIFAHLGVAACHLGLLLALSWPNLHPSCPTLQPFSRHLAPLGPILASSCPHLGPSSPILAHSCHHLGSTLALSCPWAFIGNVMWGRFSVTDGGAHLASILASSEPHLGPMLAQS